MNFLRRLLGGGGSSANDRGLYFYIRSRRSGEVVRVRLDPWNDLTPDYDNGKVTGYYARKVAVGTRDFERMEAEFGFDSNRKLLDKSVTAGEFVDEAAWLAQEQRAE